MLKIKLKTLIIKNFKGIIDLTIDFNEDQTNISGQNGIGKTTIEDSYLWLLFDKNAKCESDFNIKNTIHTELNKQDHEVTGIFDINGQENTFKKIYKENWTTKKGSDTKELTGHKTEYFINDVPKSKTEYNTHINSIVDEKVFRLLSNIMYFNNNLKWEERRNILMQFASDISNEMVFDRITRYDNKDRIDNLIHVLNTGKSFADYKKEIGAKKKKLKEVLDAIPIQISEVLRGKPQPLNWNQLIGVSTAKKEMIKRIDESMQDSIKANALVNEEIIKKQNELNSLKSRLSTLQSNLVQDKTNLINKHKSDVSNIELAIKNKENIIKLNNENVVSIQNSINSKQIELDGLYAKLSEVQSRTLPVYDFKPNTFIINEQDKFCPTCLREIENLQDKIAKMEDDFNTNEAKRKADYDTNYNHWLEKAKVDNANELAKVIELGKAKKLEVENTKKAIDEANKVLQKSIEELETLRSQFTIAKDELSKSENAVVIETDEIIALKNEINSFVIPTNDNVVDYSIQNEQKATLQKEIDEMTTQLSLKKQIEDADARVNELKQSETTNAQELASLEQMEFAIADFDKGKMNFIEEAINGKFSLVTFSMFDKQLNGGESPTCETIVEGVPYSSANTASRINAGIDIINGLSKLYNISVPVFIDNKESVNNPLKCNSQCVYLIVGLEDKLTILK